MTICFHDFFSGNLIPKQGVEIQFAFLNRSWRILKNKHLFLILYSSATYAEDASVHHIKQSVYFPQTHK